MGKSSKPGELNIKELKDFFKQLELESSNRAKDQQLAKLQRAGLLKEIRKARMLPIEFKNGDVQVLYSTLYEKGLIKQHSIGLRYVKLDLAINDKDEKEAFKVWEKYIGQIINRERAEEKGYFFPVIEQKLIEISAVVFGSNPYTPTLDNKSLENDEPSETLEVKEPNKTNIYNLLR